MVKMADEGGPFVQMRVDENRVEIVILKGAVTDIDIGTSGDEDENGTAEQVEEPEAIHRCGYTASDLNGIEGDL